MTVTDFKDLNKKKILIKTQIFKILITYLFRFKGKSLVSAQFGKLALKSFKKTKIKYLMVYKSFFKKKLYCRYIIISAFSYI